MGRMRSKAAAKYHKEELERLRAELDKHRWIPVENGPPDSIDWKQEVQVLECDSKIPMTMTMEEIFLDEGSDAEYWKPIILPD